MTTATARVSRHGSTNAKPSRDSKARERAVAWVRRAPLLPALIFLIIVTQLPFVGTLVPFSVVPIRAAPLLSSSCSATLTPGRPGPLSTPRTGTR